MTSISAASSATTAGAAQQTQHTPPSGRRHASPLASVSSLLGSSVQELQTQLDAGKSLNDIADDKGVSHEDLIAALKAGAPSGGSTSVDSTQMAEAMASQVGGPRPPAFPASQNLGGSVSSQTGVLTGSVTSRQQDQLDQLSQLLSTDSDDLVAQLQGGSDLWQMLQDRGVTRSAAAGTVGEGFLLDAKA